MRVGPHGLLQPIADALKLLLKEDIIPEDADWAIFWFAPVVASSTALLALAFIPFGPEIYIADVNVGVLAVAAMSSVGILGIILGGWSSNSHYSLLGSLRSAAQLVSYEVALSLGLLAGVMSAGSLSMVEVVNNQLENRVWGVFDNYGLMILPFLVYFIAAIAETNRSPFDLPEAESELVAGYLTEYSGFRWALFFLAEYAAMIVVAGVAVTLFWGGWLRPFPNVSWLELPLGYAFPVLTFLVIALSCLNLTRKLKLVRQQVVLGAISLGMLGIAGLFLVPAFSAAVGPFFWFVLKVAVIIYLMIWFRGTFPRLRYDQLMDLGWRVLIPAGLVLILVNGVVGIWKG
jgi:NADH-quinone oxidoreductase subunit H